MTYTFLGTEIFVIERRNWVQSEIFFQIMLFPWEIMI